MRLRAFLRNTDGLALTEYLVLTGLLTAGSVLAVSMFGGVLSTAWQRASLFDLRPEGVSAAPETAIAADIPPVVAITPVSSTAPAPDQGPGNGDPNGNNGNGNSNGNNSGGNSNDNNGNGNGNSNADNSGGNSNGNNSGGNDKAPGKK